MNDTFRQAAQAGDDPRPETPSAETKPVGTISEELDSYEKLFLEDHLAGLMEGYIGLD
jgi:hypothetical protein